MEIVFNYVFIIMVNNQQQLIEELKKKVEMIPIFLERENVIEWCKNPKFKSWETSTLRIIERLSWSKDSSYVKDFSKISFIPGVFMSWMPDSVFHEAFIKWIKSAECTLKDMISEFETFGIPSNDKNYKSMQEINIVNNIEQSQSLSINIENNLKNELTVKQYERLNEILQNKNKKTKWEKLKEFLLQLWSETLAKLLKDILLWS